MSNKTEHIFLIHQIKATFPTCQIILKTENIELGILNSFRDFDEQIKILKTEFIGGISPDDFFCVSPFTILPIIFNLYHFNMVEHWMQCVIIRL